MPKVMLQIYQSLLYQRATVHATGHGAQETSNSAYITLKCARSYSRIRVLSVDSTLPCLLTFNFY